MRLLKQCVCPGYLKNPVIVPSWITIKDCRAVQTATFDCIFFTYMCQHKLCSGLPGARIHYYGCAFSIFMMPSTFVLLNTFFFSRLLLK